MDPLVGFWLAVGIAIFVCIYAAIDQDPPDETHHYPLD